MGIPVGLLGARVLGVVLGEEKVGQDGRDDDVDKGVEGGGANNFMDMERQGRQGETVGPWLGGLGQSWNRGEREGVPHVDAAAAWLVRRSVDICGMYTSFCR